MSVYFKKGKGWRYDFTLNGKRHSSNYFKTKVEARQAEAKKREEPKNLASEVETPTDISFLELVNQRLDYVHAYKTKNYYEGHLYMARRLVKDWGNLMCLEISRRLVLDYPLNRAKVSAFTANKDLRYLRALFNSGIKEGLTGNNPTQGLEFMPVENKIKYVPSKEDVDKVLLAAPPDIQDYLV